MFEEFLSPSRWKQLRPDILWCLLPKCEEGHVLIAWPNMQISECVSEECHRAFDGCIIDREHETRFFGCILNARTQEVDAIFGVHDDDASKTFFLSARILRCSDYDVGQVTHMHRRIELL